MRNRSSRSFGSIVLRVMHASPWAPFICDPLVSNDDCRDSSGNLKSRKRWQLKTRPGSKLQTKKLSRTCTAARGEMHVTQRLAPDPLSHAQSKRENDRPSRRTSGYKMSLRKPVQRRLQDEDRRIFTLRLMCSIASFKGNAGPNDRLFIRSESTCPCHSGGVYTSPSRSMDARSNSKASRR